MEKTSKQYDKCVMCGKETEYSIDTPIDYRYNYIEGAGQICPECAIKLEERERAKKWLK